MKLDSDIQKFYFVNDPKGNYMFWLNDLKLDDPDELYCPKTTMWDNAKRRCITDPTMVKEFKNTDQRLAICAKVYRDGTV